MKERDELQQSVYDFIKNNDGVYAEQIRKGLKLSRIMTDNIIWFLLGQESIYLWDTIGGTKIYKVTKQVIKNEQL